MKVRIILSGQFRGNDKSWNSLRKFKEKHDAEVYVGSNENWNLPFVFSYIKTNLRCENTIFEKSIHPHKDRYILQWSALYQTYKHFCDMFDKDDIIIKLRNDLVFEPFELDGKLEETILVPEKEFHASFPFEPEFLCNDQVLYGTKRVMDVYFDFLYKFSWDKTHRTNHWVNHILKLNKKPMHSYLTWDCLKNFGIEEMIRGYFYQQGIKVKTFKLDYNKV